MTVRVTMTPLVARVRFHIADAPGAAQAFSELQIQDELDRTRIDVFYDALDEMPTYTPALTRWMDYYDPEAGEWESDLILTDSSFATLTPATSDLLTGHWTFSANQNPPVYIRGKRYDTYRAAARMVEAKAQSLANGGLFDFTADGASFSRSQIVASYKGLAATLYSKARPVTAMTGRADYAGGWKRR